ncbi:DUF6087 family protein [Streptomyces sp. NPDC018019]|uniref:DUF6087 family protein n=1 Tax=Streptomyces sp. NPDC018019 TaxID=3365030 RepID=UPI0037994068
MGKHRRPGPPNQPPKTTPAAEREGVTYTYDRRRQPPPEGPRRHRPVHDHGGHLYPDEPRVLEEWTGFQYVIVGTTADLAAAAQWVQESPAG